MRMKEFLALTAGLILMIGTAHARSSVPIVNHDGVAIATGTGRMPSADEFKSAVVHAGRRARYPWTVSVGAAGQLAASTVVRGKHTVSVDIKFSGASYSVTYRDSSNMNYRVDHTGIPMIHPNYNVWVAQLIDAINSELVKL